MAAIGLSAYVSTPNARAQALGLWDFDGGNLNQTAGATLGNLTSADAATTAATAFGTTASFSIPDIGGASALVMRFPAATNGMGYRMPTPGANFGSAVNQYTFIADIFYPQASAGKIRPLIQTEDGSNLGSQQFIVIDANGAIGPLKIGGGGITGPYVGQLLTNTWYRLAISVTAGGTVRVYTNGVALGSFPGGASEGFLALAPNGTALILGDTSTNAALGYVNSVQLRDSALSAGQVAALGTVSAAGIPAVIPPVPSFIASRTPDVGQLNVSQIPAVSIVLDQGDTTVNSGSIVLRLDGTIVPAVVTPSAPTFTVTYQVPPRLDPLSVHTLALSFTDSVAGSKTISWPFTVKDYQIVTLPAPFFFENFDSFTENPTPGVSLPTGWTVTNQTCPQTAGFNLDDRSSDTYKDWILVNSSRLAGWGGNRTVIPTIIRNGVELTTLTTGNLLWAESDARSGSCNGQFADLFAGPISCVGKSNVFVAFNSIYMQNQDNMNFMEYSVDGGVSWLPVLYYFDNDPGNTDFILTNGFPDITAMFARVDVNRNWSPIVTPVQATNYGSYISAPVSSIQRSHIQGRLNDSDLDGKRIEIVRLPQADGKADVRFRMNANGTSAWFWGIDDFGLYEINTPVITVQPAGRTVAAGTATNFTVTASSPSLLSYQWQRAGTNISDVGNYSGVTTATLTISNAGTNDANSYRVRISNTDGFVFSAPATLTVVTVPTITLQPKGAVVSEGVPVTLTGVAFGGLPITYQWFRNGSPVGSNSTNYSIASAQAGDVGVYALVANNSFGSVTSKTTRVSVSAGAIANNLVLHLKFDGNATDSSGRGNDGTPVGAPTFTAPGRIGSAVTLATTGGGRTVDYVTLGYPTDLKFGNSTDFSVSFWTKYTDQTSDPVFISNSDWDSSSNIGWGIFFQGGGNTRVKVTGTPRGSGNRTDTSATPNIRDGNWHHVLVTYQQGGVMNTAVDGNLVNSTAWNSTGSVDTDVVDLGESAPGPRTINIGQDGAGDYSVGSSGMTNVLMDDLGIWRRAISPTEAAAIYNAGLAGQTLAQAAIVTAIGNVGISVSGGNVNFTWTGGAGIRLQKTSPLVPANWTDIGSTLGNSSHSEPITATPTYYRLLKP